MNTPTIVSIRTETKPARAAETLPGFLRRLRPEGLPAEEVTLVEVEQFGRQAGGPLGSERVTLQFKRNGNGPWPPTRENIEELVLAAHRQDLGNWKAGD